MNNLDFTLCHVSLMLSRNTSTEYQQQVIARYTVLMAFLKANALLLKDPFDHTGKMKVDLILRQSEVTEDGLELFKKAVPAWHAYVDKGGNVENVSKLEKALEKIRG